ncbi:Glucan endo-1,3-beta-glucosidase 11 [Glycine soja]|uniref:glucan endo-1,3-beta-D-glucosidase n=1 Tax=Glycine soja TaxID=3848 RepID=A0A0B2SIE3_GLYSO|nr:Glucan endo-1,3-beta-glucosidase 11 [Glycine soja]
MHRFIILTILLSLALAGNAHLYHFISLFLFFHFCITKVNPFILHCLFVSDGGSIGVNYGRIANNLPSAVKVVQLLKSQGLTRVKVYDTDPAVLRALSGSGIKVTVDLPNQQLFAAAKAPSFASSWVERNVAAYYPHTQIESIAVGNEVFVDPHNTTKFLVPAMKNIQKALTKHNLDKDIKVSSPIALSALANSYPSSAGSFRPELVDPVFKPMLDFLRETGSYLMVNVYPFFAYESNADVISLDYALFRDNPGVVDPGNGLRYYNLFDAQIDAVFSALSALKYDDVKIVVTETGWPSKGDSNEVGASVENAAAYNGNLVRKIKLQAALDFAAGKGGSDCGPIQRGATCYDPNTLVAHASFAFNSYYQKQSRKGGSCYFGGTSYVVTQEPRYGSCEFPTGY